MLAEGAGPEALLAVADEIDLHEASPAQRLIAAEVRLKATSRFARAAALSTLEELAAGGHGAVARRAILAAAEHADAMGFSLSWVEADRIAAALANWRSDPERHAALARLDARRRIAAEQDADAIIASASELAPGYRAHLEHARAVIAGEQFDGEAPADDEELVVAGRCLRAIALLREERWRDAELSLRELSEGHRPPPAAWVVIRCAAAGPKGVRLAGLELLARMLDDGVSTPTEGFLAYAAAAHEMRAADLRERLLRAALRHGEPGAEELLVDDLTRRAREAASSGGRDRALSLLREALAIAG
jgi:hypothetical protein